VVAVGTRLEHLLHGLSVLNRPGRRRSLAEVGSLVHLSAGRAQRVFSRVVGESPGRYQHRVGLDRAAAELLATNRPVADIAFSHGFGSHEGFTRAFRARFHRSPRQYRTAAGRWDDRTAALAAATSPCVGLYRTRLSAEYVIEKENSMEQTSDHAVIVEELSPTPVLYMARRVDRDAVAEVLAELLPAVFQYVMEQGLAMAGPPYVRYVEQSAAFLSIEAGIALVEGPKPPPPELNIEVGELPGGPAATTVHVGPYDTLGDSHMVLDRWMANNGYAATGAPWEVYLTDPGEVPDPKDWMTKILWPAAEIR